MTLSLVLSACTTVDSMRDRIGIKLGGDDSAAAPAAQGNSLVHRIQTALAERGYAPGRVNGRLNGRTEAAIQDFQLDHGLAIDGRPSESLLEAILTVPVPPPA